MTLIAAFQVRRQAVLIGDLTLHSAASAQRLVSINSSCTIAWAGEPDEAAGVVADLHNLLGEQHPTRDRLSRYFEARRPRNAFIGLFTTADEHVHILAYSARRVVAPALSGPAYCAGSADAKDGFSRFIERAPPGADAADARTVVASANSLIASLAAREADPPAGGNGAAYQMAIACDGNVGKLADTTQIYWEARVAGSQIRLRSPGLFVHHDYAGQDFIVRSARCEPGGIKTLVPFERQTCVAVHAPTAGMAGAPSGLERSHWPDFNAALEAHFVRVAFDDGEKRVLSLPNFLSEASQRTVEFRDHAGGTTVRIRAAASDTIIRSIRAAIADRSVVGLAG